jgi:uncharacterized protein YbjT (DUF2867 family)
MQTDNANTQQMQPTLVLGANGKTGRRVAQRLRAQGIPVRAGSRAGDPKRRRPACGEPAA